MTHERTALSALRALIPGSSLAVLSLTWLGCRSDPPQAPPPPEVVVVQVTPRTVEQVFEFVGNVEASKSVSVRPGGWCDRGASLRRRPGGPAWRRMVADARAAVDQARKDLDDTVVRAELTGRVGKALLEVGARAEACALSTRAAISKTLSA